MKKNTIKSVLFDMDGVITDTDILHFEVWKSIMKEFGIDLTEELYLSNFQSRSHKDAIVSMLGDLSENEIKEISNRKSARSKEVLKTNIKVYEDAIALIKYLHKENYKLAVVSASTNAVFVIHEIKMEDYFDMIISGPDETNLRNKPYPDIYQYAMKTLGVKPEETVIIEDSISGITAGLKSGAYVYGINRGNLYAKEEKRLSIIDDLNQVMKEL